jgi:hypothetical protein
VPGGPGDIQQGTALVAVAPSVLFVLHVLMGEAGESATLEFGAWTWGDAQPFDWQSQREGGQITASDGQQPAVPTTQASRNASLH